MRGAAITLLLIAAAFLAIGSEADHVIGSVNSGKDVDIIVSPRISNLILKNSIGILCRLFL